MLQQGQRLTLISRYREILGSRKFRNGLVVRAELSHNDSNVGPTTMLAPNMEAGVLNLGVQDGCNVEQRDIFHVDKIYYHE